MQCHHCALTDMHRDHINSLLLLMYHKSLETALSETKICAEIVSCLADLVYVKAPSRCPVLPNNAQLTYQSFCLVVWRTVLSVWLFVLACFNMHVLYLCVITVLLVYVYAVHLFVSICQFVCLYVPLFQFSIFLKHHSNTSLPIKIILMIATHLSEREERDKTDHW